MSNSTIYKIRKQISKFKLLLKNKTFIRLTVLCLFLGLTLGSVFRVMHIKKQHEVYTRAFQVILGDKEIGYVRDKEVTLETLEAMQKKYSNQYGVNVIINEDLKFVDAHAEDTELSTKDQLESSIKANLTLNVNGYGLKINNELVTVVDTEKTGNKLIEAVKNEYVKNIDKETSKVKEVEILEDVVIEPIQSSISMISDYDKALAILLRGTDEEKIHVVEKGESFWSVANKYKISLNDLIKANPNKNPEKIQIKDKLSLIVPKPYLTVVTYEEKTYTVGIEFDTEYQNSASIYRDQTRVYRNGTYGKKEVVAKVIKHNGVEADREILSEETIKEPTSKIVLKGTKPVPPSLGYGVFGIPTGGRLTSAYGYRWGGGSFHRGIDLASKPGTAIKASDGGVVSFAGYSGSYGLLIKINHGAGFETRYAHCSKTYVKVGDKVTKGEVIGAVGNTGRSTGPHVHFEIRKYGSTYNPYSYINKKYR